MKIDTLNVVINAFNAASTDATRYSINNVLIKAAGETIIIVATDGYILSEMRVTDKDLAALIGDDKYIVNPENLKVLKVLNKTYKKMGIVPGVKENNSLKLGDTSISTTLIQDAKEFPKYEEIKPKHTDEELEKATVICFDAEYLLNLAKALKNDHRKDLGVKLLITGKDKPILVSSGENTYGLLMPRRS